MDEKILKKIRLNTNKQKNTVILIGNKTLMYKKKLDSNVDSKKNYYIEISAIV